MRRILFAAALLAALLAAAAPAEARNGHHHHGHHHHGHGHHGHWGHHHGHHHHGHWGGYGLRGLGYGGLGWGGYGGLGYGGYGWGGYGLSIGYARPFYNYGWNFGWPAYYYRPSYIYGGYYPGYCYPGYYGFYGSTQSASAVNGLVVAPRAAAGETTPAQVLNLLRLDDGNLVADLRNELAERGRTLPRIGPLQETTIATTAASRPLVNTSNIAQRRKADQQVATGDMLFREQKFHAALQRYKDASRLAPDMAEPYWRQGHALIATANFELASGAFKRALALDPTTSRDGFSLDQLYGPATIAKTSHVEDLAAWALDHANTSDSYFLMGLTLHYDGQADRAAKFFARASEIAGAAGGHIAAFVPPAPAAGPDAPALVDNAIRQPPPPVPPVAQPPVVQPPVAGAVPPIPPAAQPPFAEPAPAAPAAAPVTTVKLVEI